MHFFWKGDLFQVLLCWEPGARTICTRNAPKGPAQTIKISILRTRNRVCSAPVVLSPVQLFPQFSTLVLSATGRSLVFRLCSWGRRRTRSASEALFEFVANTPGGCVGHVALRATLMVANIVEAENPELYLFTSGLPPTPWETNGRRSLKELYHFECISAGSFNSFH